MRTLVYKMTHIGDPDPVKGVWGRTGCMGQVRGYDFDVVIGIGGTTAWDNIAGRVVWIGIGPRKTADPREPLVTFDRFLFFGSGGPKLSNTAPALARCIYGRNVRVLLKLSGAEQREADRLIRLSARSRAWLGGSRSAKRCASTRQSRYCRIHSEI